MSDPLRASAKLVNSSIEAIQRSQRIVYPGVAIALFLKHRYQLEVFEGVGPAQVPSIFLALLLGTLVYYSYRAIIHPIVWFFQSHSPIVGIPQQVFHRRICNELTISGVARDSIRFSQACLGYFQTAHSEEIKAPSPYAFNSGSHLLYMTGTIGFYLFIHDALFLHLQRTGHWVNPTPYDLVAWALLLILGLAAGISYDRSADYREAIVLYQNENLYKEILEKVKATWPEGQFEFTKKARKTHIRWIIKRLWVPAVLLLLLIVVVNAMTWWAGRG